MRAGIALGSNLGDRRMYLNTAIEHLGKMSLDPIRDKISSIYETIPIDCAPNTPNFLNAVMEIETQDSPPRLLKKLQALELQAGRPAHREKNTPRSLDLDLLYLDDMTHSDEHLTIPHPLIFERLFVLIPLAEISPDRILPNRSDSIQEALMSFKNELNNIITKYI